jgi:hypothetical protein
MYFLKIASTLIVGHYDTWRKVAGSSPVQVDFFNLLNPSSRTMAVGSTQEWEPGIFLGGRERPASKANNLTAICEPIV